MRAAAWGAALACLAALAPSPAPGQAGTANPVARSLNWYHFLNGSDLRRQCRPGAGDIYRFVYNGRWGEQVRIYELRPTADGGARLDWRILFPETLTELRSDDLLAPWRGREGAAQLAPADMAAVERALRASGFDERAPRGLTLPSDGFYWVAYACRDGASHFNAWAYPSERFSAIAFGRELLRHDRSGLALAEPFPDYWRSRMESMHGDTDSRSYRQYSIFDLVVGDNGLRGLPPALF